MFLAYLLAGLLVLILGDVANRRAFPIIWCELFGIAVSLSFGYVFTRRFILARPKLKPMAGEEAALG